MDKLTQIKNTITDFLRGGDTNDVALLEKVLHPDFQNTQDGFFEQQGIFTFSKEAYIHLVETKRFGGSPRTVDFVSLDDLGNLVVAKVLLESDRLKFTSYIIVAFDGTRWTVIKNIPSIEIR